MLVPKFRTVDPEHAVTELVVALLQRTFKPQFSDPLAPAEGRRCIVAANVVFHRHSSATFSATR